MNNACVKALVDFSRYGLFGVATLLTACGGNPLGGSADALVYRFAGLEPSDVRFSSTDGRYALSWRAPLGDPGVFHVYRYAKGTSVDWKKASAKVAGSSYLTGDMRFEAPFCFAVAWAENEKAEPIANAKFVCPNHTPAKFSGIASLAAEESGTYLLRWSTPTQAGKSVSAAGLLYNVYASASRDPSKFDFKNPALASAVPYARYDDFALGEVKCFIVRYVKLGVRADTNTTVKCADDNALSFAGLESAEPVDVSSVVLRWTHTPNSRVSGYRILVYRQTAAGRIFQGSRSVGLPPANGPQSWPRRKTDGSCESEEEHAAAMVGVLPSAKVPAGTLVCASDVLQDLTGDESFAFVVRAVDSGDHEDRNTVTKCSSVIGASGAAAATPATDLAADSACAAP